MLQHLVEQPAERLEMARAEPVRRTEVRRLVARQSFEAQPLAARLRDLPRRMQPEAVGVDDRAVIIVGSYAGCPWVPT